MFSGKTEIYFEVTTYFGTVVQLTHRYACEDKQSDAGGHPQKAIA